MGAFPGFDAQVGALNPAALDWLLGPSPAAISIVSLDGLTLWANPAWHRVVGTVDQGSANPLESSPIGAGELSRLWLDVGLLEGSLHGFETDWQVPNDDGSSRTRRLAVSAVRHDERLVALLLVASHDLGHTALANPSHPDVKSVASTEARYRQLVRHLGDAVFELDRAETIVFASCAWGGLLGVNSDDLVGLPVEQLLALDPDALQCYRSFRAGDGEQLHYERFAPRAGRWFEVQGFRHREADGCWSGLIGVVLDVTARKLRERELSHQALHDPLTGLANRSQLEARLGSLWNGARSIDEGLVAVLFVDLDDFKQVNDRYGHQRGDEFLQAVATRLVRNSRQQDLVARIGGDEFVVAVPSVASSSEAVAIAERLMSGLCEPVSVGGQELAISASIGVAVANPLIVLEPTEVIADADAAMYRAKQSGKNRIAL